MSIIHYSFENLIEQPEKGKGIKVDSVIKTDALEISALHLKKDTFYSIKNTDSEVHYKTYTVISGKAYLVEEGIYLKSGDILYVNNLSDRINFLVLDDMSLYFQSYNKTSLESLVKNISDVSNILQQIQDKDQYTDEHCNRVYHLGVRIGIKMGYKGTRLLHLVHATRYHDIGKIYVPEHILNKPGRLDDDEMAIMKDHVIKGAELIKDYDSDLIFNMISQHHERLDGSGYPYGLTEDEILEESKILAVCDSFDAMITNRVYKSGKSMDDALNELISMSGTHYDEKIVKLLIEVLEEEKNV